MCEAHEHRCPYNSDSFVRISSEVGICEECMDLEIEMGSDPEDYIALWKFEEENNINWFSRPEPKIETFPDPLPEDVDF